MDDASRIQPDATGLTFENATMSDLQLFLSSTRGLSRPVINRMGLDGRFDFKLAILTGTDSEEARKAAISSGNIVAGKAFRELDAEL